MSLYNMIFGVNPFAPLGLEALGLTEQDCGRFRDCFLTEVDGELRICVHTRNGGGNREHWDDCEPGPECGCSGCVITYQLPQHPNYIRDYDDEFDCTYATIEFSIPERFIGLIGSFSQMEEVKGDPAKRWQELFKGLKEEDLNNPDVQKAMKAGEKIFGEIKKGKHIIEI